MNDTTGQPALGAVRQRADVPRARRIVVKVGSSSVSGEATAQIGPLVDALAAARAELEQERVSGLWADDDADDDDPFSGEVERHHEGKD